MRFIGLIFSALFCLAGVCCTPVFADDTSEEVSVDVDLPEATQESAEFDDISQAIYELGWCSEYSESPNKDARKNELCNKIKEIEVDVAEQNYQAAKDRETSLKNRVLDAVGIGTVGIGGMMAASALSEQAADAAAEQDMQSYLATFQCIVGDDVYPGGKTGIELGGANQLINLYTQYKDLAADLKERKTALGMKAGIESEVILDKADMGLYDDVGHGIENGTYASLYRASRGNADDQATLNEQREKTSNNLKIGATVAAAGAVATAAANYALNHKDKNSEFMTQQQYLASKYQEIAQQIIDECNRTIQEHRDYAKTLTDAQLQDPEILEYKRSVDAANNVKTLSDLKDNVFCQ